MRILFISNFPTEKICEIEKIKCNYKEGWVSGYLSVLSHDNEIVYSFPYSKKTQIVGKIGERITYHSYYRKDNNWKYTQSLQKRINEFVKKYLNVDIIHIMGTEYGSTLAFLKAANIFGIGYKCVVSLQGIIWTCAFHYYGGINIHYIRKWSLGDLYYRHNIELEKKFFYKRGVFEKESFVICNNVIGRTEYDFATVKLINNKVNYYQCGEILRSSFYENKWNYDRCDKNRIFVSQGNYPIKGLHFLIMAMGLLIQKNSLIQVYVTGRDILKCNVLTSYQKYLKRIIKQLGCQNNIHFLGKLNESQMVDQYLKANVYVNPSVIENSSNSIGEAMILGVPIVASDVGGTKDIIKDKEEGFLYQYDAFYMLAYYIDKILGNKEMAISLSCKARIRGQNNHNKQRCYDTLIDIYKDIKDV